MVILISIAICWDNDNSWCFQKICQYSSSNLLFILLTGILFLVEDELMREHALGQILILLDIPILDNILSYEAMKTKPTGKRKAYSNMAFKRCESVMSLYSSNSDK